MERTPPHPFDRWLNLLDPVRIARFLLHRHVRLVVAWAIALVVAWQTFSIGWNCMNAPTRNDCNNAHVNIDFSGQYLLGRMIVVGQGPYLYREAHQAPVLDDAYPASAQDPDHTQSDSKDIEDWMIGVNSTDVKEPSFWARFFPPASKWLDRTDIKGPLYPPVHALLFAPLTFLPPLKAYRVMQVITFLLTSVVPFLPDQITHARLCCPVPLLA